MPELAISYKDSSLHENHMQHSFLSVCVGVDSFKSCITNKEKNKTVFYQNIKNFSLVDFEKIITSEKIYQSKFLHTYLSIESVEHSLIPKQFFDTDQQTTYLNFNSKKEINSQQTENDYLPLINAYNVYQNRLESKQTSLLSNMVLMHQNSFFINFCHLISKLQKRCSVFLSVHKNYFTLVVYSADNELLLSNNYLFKNEEDIAYHLFFSLEKLKISPDDFHLNSYSNGVETSRLIKIITPFTKHINPLQNPLKIDFSKVIPLDVIRSDYLLFTQHLCV